MWLLANILHRTSLEINNLNWLIVVSYLWRGKLDSRVGKLWLYLHCVNVLKPVMVIIIQK